MPTNISGRVTLILAVLLLALWAIFPSGNIFRPDLKPGIDMVGGTSLLYEIKAPEGSYQPDLAEKVMDSLKKRVDPDGVRNLVWRPQGGNRLEIQMPLSARSEEAGKLRDAYIAAQKKLDDTNVRPGEVIYAVQELHGEQRAAKLKQLEQGSETRAKLLGALSTTWDQIQQAKASKDALKQGELETQYDKLLDQLTDTNLTANNLESILELKSDQTREQKLADLKKRFADFPERLAAIDSILNQYASYSKIKGSVDAASDLKRLLQGSGVLEFHILADDISPVVSQEMRERLLSRGPVVQAGDEVRWYPVEKPEEFRGMTVELNEKHYALLYTTPDKEMIHADNIPRWGLNRAGLTTMNGEKIVTFEFDPQGAKLFGELTGNNIGRKLAIVLDDKLISAPNINSQIFGNGQISGGKGGFSNQEANYLVNTLNAGSLPAQLNDEPISEQQIGPQLGADTLRAGLLASIIGLVVVAIFMISYYHISGIVAVIALLMNMVLILGVMSALNATWTLPAVAGIVLTIGMSVDANVLVFERLREEQARGLSLRMALRNAYAQAASAIIDSNAVTAITCVILYYIGSEEVKGFGLTLLIGLISSLFTALFVTKTIFAAMLNNFHLTRLGSLPVSFPPLGRLLHPNVNWMRLSKYFMASSAVVVALGVISLFITGRKGELFDIEFSSGTSVQFETREPMPISEVRSLLTKHEDEAALPSPSIVAVNVGKPDTTYEVITPSNDSKAVVGAVLTAMQGKLNLLEPSTYDMVDATYADAMDKAIIPITSQTRQVAGLAPAALRSHVGGIAIVLKDLSPKLSADQIKARLDQIKLQSGASSSAAGAGGAAGVASLPDFDVETNADGSLAVVMTSDPSMQYDATDAVKLDQWTQQLVKPAWAAVAQAIHNPPKLQKVNNFNPQVAGEMQRDALLALSFSLVVVMGYIWLRFGNLKYGTATVVAMLHDTVLVIGFIGLSHFLAHTYVGRHILLIEPFRVNLTLVAAVLTVMSYSMVDTIVVFDRIRENRGKFGHLDSRIINDSVNQTLSRTLLTVTTTTLTLLVMYIFGGPGIHGFTFVMLVGILIGTYSSFAIAAPILLIGEHVPQDRTGKSKGRAATPPANRPPGQQLQGA